MGRLDRLTLTGLVAAALLPLVSGCSRPEPLAGRIADDTIKVMVPALATPAPDLDAGFSSAAGERPAAGASSGRATPSSFMAITAMGGWSRVHEVIASEGSSVTTGAVLARLDDAALQADLAAALAAEKTAASQVALIDARLDDVAEGRAELSDARAEAVAAIAQARQMRKRLADQLAQVRFALAQVERMRKGTRTPPAGATAPRPPGGTPGAGIPDVAAMEAAEQQLVAAIARIDAGLSQGQRGLATIASARARLSDARSQLDDARELAVIAAQASSLSARMARERLSLAVLTSPCSGVVVAAPQPGDVLATGATATTVRPVGVPRVETWLPPESLAKLEIGSHAEVGGDWREGRVSGRVARIGTRAVYPPTSFATTEVHLTRAVPVEIELPEQTPYPLPPGAPVDVWIR